MKEAVIQNKKNTSRGGLLVLSGASLWGVIGLFNRGLMSAGLSPQSVVLLRNFGGLAVLLLVLLVMDRSVFRIRRCHLKYFFGTGVVSVMLFTLCYFSCQKECSLAVSAILLYTAPAFVVLLSALLWREKVTRRRLAALVLTFLGCTFVVGLWGGGAAVTPRGVLLGLGSGFFYALYSIFGRCALAYYRPLTVTFYTFAFAGAGSLILLQPDQMSLLFGSGSMLLTALGLVVVSTVAPYILYTSGLARMDSGKASILASIEPVVAALIGAAVFAEPIGWMTAAGICCVLAGVWILR